MKLFFQRIKEIWSDVQLHEIVIMNDLIVQSNIFESVAHR